MGTGTRSLEAPELDVGDTAAKSPFDLVHIGRQLNTIAVLLMKRRTVNVRPFTARPFFSGIKLFIMQTADVKHCGK